MKSDIASKENIKLIITEFYNKLLADDNMQPFFKDIVEQNQLDHHLDLITDFWNDILFDTISYKNNVMQKHLDKSEFIVFKKQHFAIWVSYFLETIQTYFDGENAERMKARAQSIATIMQVKMNLYSNK